MRDWVNICLIHNLYILIPNAYNVQEKDTVQTHSIGTRYAIHGPRSQDICSTWYRNVHTAGTKNTIYHQSSDAGFMLNWTSSWKGKQVQQAFSKTKYLVLVVVQRWEAFVVGIQENGLVMATVRCGVWNGWRSFKLLTIFRGRHDQSWWNSFVMELELQAQCQESIMGKGD